MHTRRESLKKVLAITGMAGAAFVSTSLWAQIQQASSSTGAGVRRALVCGNTSYHPERQAIPSARKNAHDLEAVLGRLGFEVHREIDQGTRSMRTSIEEFFSQLTNASDRALAIFYFTGHGVQYRGENYIVPSDVDLQQGAEAIAKASINVDREILARASLPADGSVALIFDACRNDPTKGKEDRVGSFNQVNPPRGTIITYSTAPGKYAIAPKSADANSIYTEILVQELQKANASITIKDLLDAVKFRVRDFMQTHPEEFLRKHAQDPEVAANLLVNVSFAYEKAPVPTEHEEQQAWQRITETVSPADRLKLLKEFVDTYKESRFLQSAQVQLERAAITDAITQKNPVQIETAIGDAQFRVDQAKALDGDKDAAFRVAQMFERGTNGVPRDEKRRVQWLRHASELKNGIASYQLYLYFVERGIDREAVRYENRAREQGYEPPPRLASVR
jgi:hypothetical protein